VIGKEEENRSIPCTTALFGSLVSQQPIPYRLVFSPSPCDLSEYNSTPFAGGTQARAVVVARGGGCSFGEKVKHLRQPIEQLEVLDDPAYVFCGDHG